MRDLIAFYDGALVEKQAIELSRDESQHLLKVRRVRQGATVFVLNGCGTFAEAKLLEADRSSARLEITNISQTVPQPSPRISLAVGVTKSSAFDDMIQRAVELGMTDLIPIITDRSDSRLDEKKRDQRCEKWARVFRESLKQCERLWLPELHGFRTPQEVIEESGNGLTVALVERGGETALPLRDVIGQIKEKPAITFLIGPEGGWSESERSTFESEGVLQGHLGNAILRTETACLAALSTVLALAPSD